MNAYFCSIMKCSGKILLSFIGALMLTGVNAQSVLQGIVQFEKNLLVNATVSLKGKAQKQITDSTGAFRFDLPAGKYTLQITTVGFEPFYQGINLSEKDSKKLSIEMQPSNSSLSEVVVTGTMKQMHRLESPIAVEVYTPNSLKKTLHRVFSKHFKM